LWSVSSEEGRVGAARASTASASKAPIVVAECVTTPTRAAGAQIGAEARFARAIRAGAVFVERFDYLAFARTGMSAI